jgi:PucR family transcriptional regulator, purine catabolism regulatory protein
MAGTGEGAGTLPTVAQVLELPAVRRGQPRVAAGGEGLGAGVRWVHAIELADAARLLRGGELVLTTGIALPDGEDELGAYVDGLAGVGVSAVAVELARRYSGGLPGALVAAARRHRLPLIAFEREVPFIEITEAVHALILEDQMEQLRAAARLHEVFTDLAVAGAGPAEIVRQAALLSGRPVILADLSHRVLACEPAGADPALLLDRFSERSRAVALTGRTSYDEPAGWLVTIAGARGEDWGRVIMVCDGAPRPSDPVLLERTATTLALARLLSRQRDSLERQAHSTLIGSILAQADTDPSEAAVRARALGVPVTGRQLLTLVISFGRPGSGLAAQARVLEAAEAVAAVCRAERVPALAGALGEDRAAALLSVSQQSDPWQVLAAVCTSVRQRLASPPPGPVIGAGSVAASMQEVRRCLLEAQHAADAAAASTPAGRPRPYYLLADLRLRGLLHLFGGDARLANFVDRELGPLLAHDRAHGTHLARLLAAYLAEGGNKAAAAARAHLARPTFYARLAHIERILGVSLESPESRTSLHVALLALAASRAPAG